MKQAEKARELRAMHKPGEPLVLVNAWDAVSARIVEELGFSAVATTSAGVAFSAGFADGEHIPREKMLEGVRSIAAAVDVPVSADLESGYGSSVEAAALTARGAVHAGAVGLNFEDASRERLPLIDRELQCRRIAAIVAAGDEMGVPLVVNARTDVFLAEAGDNDEWRLEEAIARANAFLQAGAACAFVPGVTDEKTIAALAERIEGPLNVLAGAATPPLSRLRKLGVARVSLGSATIGVALAAFRNFARGIHKDGTFERIADRISHSELNALFR